VDLPLYMRVLWRFKWLVIFGVIAAIALSVLAVARVDTANGFKLSYRQSPEYSVQSVLFVTQQGFPWGYAAPPDSTQGSTQAEIAAQAKALGGKQFADPSRFPGLAALYAYLAMSDPVKQIMRKSGPVKDGVITAQPVISTVNGYGTSLPLVAIAATGSTPGAARKLVIRATDAFREFLDQQQVANEIPSQNRVLVTVLQRADKPVLVKGRSKTLPLVVFVTVLTAMLGLAFLLENVRPRVRPVREEEAIVLPTPGRQSA
jgi:hypothetical protein